MFAISSTVFVPHIKIPKQPFVHLEAQDNISNILLTDFETYYLFYIQRIHVHWCNF